MYSKNAGLLWLLFALALSLVLVSACGGGDDDQEGDPPPQGEEEEGGEGEDGGTTDDGDGADERSHAGAIDDDERHPYPKGPKQTDRPQWANTGNGLPGSPPEDLDCSCTCSGPTGPATVGSNSEDNRCAPIQYGTTVSCSGDANFQQIVWDKTSGHESIRAGSAPYRWCDDNGTNQLTDRAAFCCALQSGDDDQVKVSKVCSPMCSTGRFITCARAIFTCGEDETVYSSEPCCIEVERNITAELDLDFDNLGGGEPQECDTDPLATDPCVPLR